MTRLIGVLLQPRTLLLGMMYLGGAGLLYVLIAASIPKQAPWEAAEADLITGEVAGFVPTQMPRPAPDELLDPAGGGEGVFLSNLVGGGEVTVVNLWASWCAPCLEELPSLVSLSEKTGARLVPVAMERISPATDKALERAGVTGAFPVLHDADLSLMRSFDSRSGALPMTILYDGQGREVGVLRGAADWASPEAVTLVRAVADRQPL